MSALIICDRELSVVHLKMGEVELPDQERPSVLLIPDQRTFFSCDL